MKLKRGKTQHHVDFVIRVKDKTSRDSVWNEVYSSSDSKKAKVQFEMLKAASVHFYSVKLFRRKIEDTEVDA